MWTTRQWTTSFLLWCRRLPRQCRRSWGIFRRYASLLNPPSGRKWVPDELAVISESKEVSRDMISGAVLDQVRGYWILSWKIGARKKVTWCCSHRRTVWLRSCSCRRWCKTLLRHCQWSSGSGFLRLSLPGPFSRPHWIRNPVSAQRRFMSRCPIEFFSTKSFYFRANVIV